MDNKRINREKTSYGLPDEPYENNKTNQQGQKIPEGKSENAIDRIREWRLSLSIDGDLIAKAVVCFIIIVFLALIQTTLFARYRPFGAVPDLILPAVIAISMTEREKWGAVFGLIGAFIIESLGGSSVTLLALLYMPAGYLCGLFTIYYFRDSAAVRAIFTAAALVGRVIISAIVIFSTSRDATLVNVLRLSVLPEFISGMVFAVIPHLIVYFALKPFNKSRAEKVKD